MRKPSVRSLILSVSLLLMSAFPSESETVRNADQILRAVKENGKNLKSFTAKFAKLKQTNMPTELLFSEGKVSFDDSGKLLIEITGALPMKLLLSDNRLTMYYPDLNKIEKTYVGTSIIRKYFGIGEPLEKLKQKYNVRLVSPPSSDDAYHLQFIPRKKYILEYISFLNIIVNSQNWLPSQIEFRTANGDYTTLGLQFLSINEPIPPAVFRIEIPENK
jgi:outer membrane lipoprotein-sorting protein